MGVACLEFREENFCGWQKYREIRESFLPRKFPAIRYMFANLIFVQFSSSMHVYTWDEILAYYDT